MANTIVYIDVDGVINSFKEKRKLAGWEGNWKVATVNGYRIHWYTDLVDELNKLAKTENVTVKWLTTWQDQAAKDLSPALGIEGQYWDVVYKAPEDSMFNHSSGWWKLKAIINDQAIHNPDKVVWIDDEFKYDRTAIDWASYSDTIHAVSPDGYVGMTKDEFNGIIEFINS
jgi:hypothetical protein